MNVSYTKIIPEIKTNGFEFIFYFEHGDADYKSKQSYFYQMTEQQAIEYFKKSEKISNQIDDFLSIGNFPKDFSDQQNSNGFHIPIERDAYANMSTYFASSGILETYYYNETGEKFLVDFSSN